MLGSSELKRSTVSHTNWKRSIVSGALPSRGGNEHEVSRTLLKKDNV
jgi:hypothetical protein